CPPLLDAFLVEGRHLGVAQGLLVDADVVDQPLRGPGPVLRAGAGDADAPRLLARIARGLVRLPLGGVLELAVDIELRRARLAVDDAGDVVPLARVVRILPRARAGPDRILAAGGGGEPMLHHELLLVVVAQARVPSRLD